VFITAIVIIVIIVIIIYFFLFSTSYKLYKENGNNIIIMDQSCLNIAIGIDLGTTYSCVGVYKDGNVEIITNDQGNRITPSYLAFTQDERLIGDAAKQQANNNPQNTIFDAKRLIGRKFSDPDIQSDIKHLPFSIKCGDNDNVLIEVNYKGELKVLTPEEISAAILLKMKETAEHYLGHSVNNAVITVPAYFNDAQRRATQDAATIAGLNILRIINEPTAAAIAYGLQNELSIEKNILVFDLGGGTFDVSLLTIDNGLYEVKAVGGVNHLGGEDFDNKLIVYCLKEFKNKYKHIDTNKLLKNIKVLSKLRSACEKAKKILSSVTTTTIDIESLFEGLDFQTKLTRAKFENLCIDEFNKCLEPVKKVLSDANMRTDQVDDIILVGGSTRIPKIVDILRNFFNKEPKKDINPDEAVAYGAAIQAAILSKQQTNEQISSIVLVDVTPLSLGLETANGIMTKLIARNSIIPCNKEQVFTTYSDNQPDVTIKIYEGERELVAHNNLLGVFKLSGILPMPRGVPKICVKFNLDTNGVLQVSATEESTNNSKNIIIKNDKNRFTKEQLNTMITNANTMATEDQLIRERINAKNDLENYLYSIRNSVDSQEIRDKLGEYQFKIINDIVNDTIYWLESNKKLYSEEYKTKQSEIIDQITPIMTSIYQKN